MKERTITLETPEKIKFYYRIADIGTRIAAYFLDLLIQVLVLLVLVLILIFGGISMTVSGEGSDLMNYASAFFLILLFIIHWFYFVFFEVIMEGQSPGKKVMRIRVIKDNGEPLDFETIILRNVLRVVDDFPFLPLLAGFISMIDKKSRRLGDMVANTIVVNEIEFNLEEPDFFVKFTDKSDNINKGSMNNKLNEEELYIIRKFLNEKFKLGETKRNEVAAKLAEQVKNRLKVDQAEKDPVLFLERIYKNHGI